MWWALVFFLVAFRVDAYEIKQLSEQPRIFVINNFLSEAECDHLISYARPKLSTSTVVDSETGEDKIHSERTSVGMFCPDDHEDAIISNIEQRISEVVSIPKEHGEGIQIINYGTGAEFRPHYDYFDPKHPGSIVNCKAGGQRRVTAIIYLNTPEKGGETLFPIANVSIQPVKGTALFFYNLLPSGEVDPLTLHAGAPVLKGEKWIATRWLREKPYQ